MTLQKLKQHRILWIATLIILFGALALMFNNPGMLYANNTWEATYWNDPILSGEPVLHRYEAEINYDWAGLSPDPVVNVDNFSIRWNTVMQADSGVYRFSATTDDGMVIYVDGVPVINSWYDSKVHTVTADVPLNAGPHQVVVEYYEAGGVAIAKVNWAMISSGQPTPPPPGGQPMPPPPGGQPVPPPSGGQPMPPPSNQGWQGQYYNNKDLGGDPALVRTDPQVKFDWGYGSPAPTIQSDNFSVRWTTNLNLPAGRYRFNVTTDDGARLWVNNQMLINQWFDHPVTTFSAEIDLPGGAVPVQMEYYENLLLAEAALTWQNLSGGSNPGTGGPFPLAVVTASYLNVRQGPGANFAVITTVTKGTELRLAGYRNDNGSWVQAILPNNVKGWVNSSYIYTDYPIQNLKVWPTDNKPNSSTATVTANYLNVRYGPGVRYGVFNTLQKGQTVIMNGRNADGSWVQVRLPDGNIGWVNANYINPSRPINQLPVVG